MSNPKRKRRKPSALALLQTEEGARQFEEWLEVTGEILRERGEEGLREYFDRLIESEPDETYDLIG